MCLHAIVLIYLVSTHALGRVIDLNMWRKNAIFGNVDQRHLPSLIAVCNVNLFAYVMSIYSDAYTQMAMVCKCHKKSRIPHNAGKPFCNRVTTFFS